MWCYQVGVGGQCLCQFYEGWVECFDVFGKLFGWNVVFIGIYVGWIVWCVQYVGMVVFQDEGGDLLIVLGGGEYVGFCRVQVVYRIRVILWLLMCICCGCGVVSIVGDDLGIIVVVCIVVVCMMVLCLFLQFCLCS